METTKFFPKSTLWYLPVSIVPKGKYNFKSEGEKKKK